MPPPNSGRTSIRRRQDNSPNTNVHTMRLTSPTGRRQHLPGDADESTFFPDSVGVGSI